VKAVDSSWSKPKTRAVRGKSCRDLVGCLPALAGQNVRRDFFSHIERVREFCKTRDIALRDAAERCVVLPQPDQEQLRQILNVSKARHSAFGRHGSQSADAALEGDLSKRGLDAYQAVYARYAFCAICSRRRWVTLLSDSLASEVIRACGRRSAFDIHIARPN